MHYFKFTQIIAAVALFTSKNISKNMPTCGNCTNAESTNNVTGGIRKKPLPDFVYLPTDAENIFNITAVCI